MTIRVKLFAAAKERAGVDELTLDMPPGATIAALREKIANEHAAIAAILPHALWAVDTEYAGDNTPLTEQSEIALIPPVSGG
jgi:molybdopterin converting factor subunit 1